MEDRKRLLRRDDDGAVLGLPTCLDVVDRVTGSVPVHDADLVDAPHDAAHF